MIGALLLLIFVIFSFIGIYLMSMKKTIHRILMGVDKTRKRKLFLDVIDIIDLFRLYWSRGSIRGIEKKFIRTVLILTVVAIALWVSWLFLIFFSEW